MTSRIARYLRTPKAALLLAFLPLIALNGLAPLPHLLAAVLGAYAGDLLPGWASGKNRRSTSPLLSGLIVGFVLGVETVFAVTVAVGVLASASKYVLRSGRGHVFNPAALALALAVPFWATGQSWWGALADMPTPFAIVLLLTGAFVVDRVAKWPMVLSFLGAYFAFFTGVGFASPAQAAEMFRAPFVQAALFLAFFMLTDPPTSPGRDRDQVWMGLLAALVAGGAQLAGAGQVYLLLGVLAVNVALAGQRFAHDLTRQTAHQLA